MLTRGGGVLQDSWTSVGAEEGSRRGRKDGVQWEEATPCRRKRVKRGWQTDGHSPEPWGMQTLRGWDEGKSQGTNREGTESETSGRSSRARSAVPDSANVQGLGSNTGWAAGSHLAH